MSEEIHIGAAVRLAADEDDESVVRSFPKMCAFSVEVMGQEIQTLTEKS